MEAAVDFVTAKDQLGESFIKNGFHLLEHYSSLFSDVIGWCSYTVEINRITSRRACCLTNDINTTVALALLTSFYFYAGLSKKGLGYFKRYIQPIPLLLPINILEDFTKPLSLSFRLFGNILADELTVTVLTSLVPLIPLPIMLLGIFAGSVQALIFSTLAAAYIAEALE
jgi:F-type H+-transporting ATPase subunit a